MKKIKMEFKHFPDFFTEMDTESKNSLLTNIINYLQKTPKKKLNVHLLIKRITCDLLSKNENTTNIDDNIKYCILFGEDLGLLKQNPSKTTVSLTFNPDSKAAALLGTTLNIHDRDDTNNDAAISCQLETIPENGPIITGPDWKPICTKYPKYDNQFDMAEELGGGIRRSFDLNHKYFTDGSHTKKPFLKKKLLRFPVLKRVAKKKRNSYMGFSPSAITLVLEMCQKYARENPNPNPYKWQVKKKKESKK